MRVAANWTSAYIDEYGESAFFDRYYDKQLFVDANASYRILPNLRLFVDANNLTNQPLRYFQGVATRVAQAEFYNARFQAGIKFDI
jgi:outer membrane receptor protein involved in Fe transport